MSLDQPHTAGDGLGSPTRPSRGLHELAACSREGLLVDEVRMDVLPVVFASHKPYYFGAVPAQHLLEDPDVDSAQPGASPALSSVPA